MGASNAAPSLATAAQEAAKMASISILPKRFQDKIRIAENGCWIWIAGKNNGYGRTSDGDAMVYAHRAVYERVKGPIPEGLTLDHDCHTKDLSCEGGVKCPHRACVNPEHMVPMPGVVNVLLGRGFTAVHARKTHCSNGHVLVPLKNGGHTRRFCPICCNERSAAFAASKGMHEAPRNPRVDTCKHGHPYTPENTATYRGSQHCRECARIRQREWKQRHKQLRVAA
jgi:hypothetical protein